MVCMLRILLLKNDHFFQTKEIIFRQIFIFTDTEEGKKQPGKVLCIMECFNKKNNIVSDNTLRIRNFYYELK